MLLVRVSALCAALFLLPRPAGAQVFGQYGGADPVPVNGRVFGAYLHTSDVVLGGMSQLRLSIYPNVDFYSGLIMRAIGIPLEMFTVIFAIGRMPGWIANFKEITDDTKSRIYRPRQVYVGPTLNHYVPLHDRK